MDIEEKIRTAAHNTDAMISRLDTLNSRIDAAVANNNHELSEYYERQFAEASVQFMDGVENILDSWYSLHGRERPSAANEWLSPEDLDAIHGDVVKVVRHEAIQIRTAPEETAVPSEEKEEKRRKGLDLRG